MSDAVRPPVVETTAGLSWPSRGWRDAAEAGPFGRERHEALMAEAACMQAVELVQPDEPETPERSLVVAAWNLERCKHVQETATLLALSGADICLLTEMDFGMARAGNRHTTADVAADLGMGYAYGVEFVELDLGDVREQVEHAGEPNEAGLHGNAVASGFAIDRAAILPLDPGGLWFTDEPQNDQKRIGGRMGVAIRVLLPQPVWFVAVHYESRLGPADRDRETEALLSHIDALCGDEPVLIGGDFNCRAIADDGLTGEDILARPETAEPMFARFAAAGFGWADCNTAGMTTRLHPWQNPETPLKKIEWFFARGLQTSAPRVVAATGPDGRNLSDHEMLLVTVTL